MWNPGAIEGCSDGTNGAEHLSAFGTGLRPTHMPEHGHRTCPECDSALSGSEQACPDCGGGLFGIAPKASAVTEAIRGASRSVVERGATAIAATTEAMQVASESIGVAIERGSERIGDTVIPVFSRAGHDPDPADASLLPSGDSEPVDVSLPFLEPARVDGVTTPIQTTTATDSSAAMTFDQDADGLVSRGEALAGMGDLEAAMKAFNAAIAADPSHAMAWFDRGVVLEQTGLSEDATKSFRICLAHDSDHAPAHANLASILDRMGDPAAVEHATIALAAFPGHSMLASIAGPVVVSPMPDGAAPSEEVEEAVVSEPVTVDEAGMQGDIWSGLGEGSIAGRPVGLVLGGTSAMVSGGQPAGDLSDSDPDPDGLAEQASIALRSGDAQTAHDLLREVLHGAASGHSRCWRVAGGALAMLGRIDESIDAFTESLNLDNEDPAGWFNLGMLHRRNGNIDSACTCFAAALSLDEEHAKSAYALADVRLQLGDVEGSLESWRTLLTLQPDHPDRVRFARMLIEIAEGEGTILETHTELPPTLPEGPVLSREANEVMDGIRGTEADLLRARAHTIRSEHSDAILIIKGHLERDKENPEPWELLARALIAAGENEKASRCRAKAAALRGEVITESEPLVAETPDSTKSATETTDPSTTGQDHDVPDAADRRTAEQSPHEPAYEKASEGTRQSRGDDEESSQDDSMLWSDDPWATATETEPVGRGSDSASADITSTVDHAAVERAEVMLPRTSEPEAILRQTDDPEIDLAKAALDAQSAVTSSNPVSAESSSVANTAVEWYNKAVVLLEDKRFKQALSCYDKALTGAAEDDDLAIRVLNGRGHALYYMENYGDCIRAYHDAMRIDKTRVSGQALYNMGTAYAEVQLYDDAIQCFKQAQRRGLDKDEKAMCKEQVRRCNELLKVKKRHTKP